MRVSAAGNMPLQGLVKPPAKPVVMIRYGGLSRSALGRTPPPSAVFKIIVMGIKKKIEPISDLENPVRIILVWCGKQDWILTARRRSVSAALRPHCGLIHYGFFKSHALRFFVSKTKSLRFSRKLLLVQ